MPEPYDFADSTDWLPTPLAALAPLESSLRCQVCKDFFTTPMMTSCSHTFCSLCIRRYLSQEGRCPACREADQEVKLRRNWVLEDLVANFTASRKGLLEFARNAAVKLEEDNPAEAQRPKKRRKVEGHRPDGVERRSTRSQSKRTASGASQHSVPSTPEVIEDSEEGSVYEDVESKSPRFNGTHELKDGLVECPCCHRRMKENLINSHLDKCIMGDSHTPVDDTSSPAPHIAPPGTIAYMQKRPSKQNDRLPFINYSLLNDNALRKKLRDLGIPNHGSKELMRRRHTEWVNLWNANCDSTNPVSKRQLLQELKVWEDTLGRQGDKAGSTGFMAKDFDRDHYVRNQKSNFDDLIKQARLKKSTASETPAPTAEEEEEKPTPPPREDAVPTRQPRAPDLSQLEDGPSKPKQHSDADGTTTLASRSQPSALHGELSSAPDQQSRPNPPSPVPKDVPLSTTAASSAASGSFHRSASRRRPTWQEFAEANPGAPYSAYYGF
ncbi:hypothetical protein A1O1_09278 [Capronia coronata CBS 617.96]|uniref:Postreplication repair E3 ubiquitin-protein ligase RAD18 n=1 Tax=Capronia coronata CBS 617.96 TaxID=1182541 RepID=W9XPK1_9EURO|nr:uncharacterized protein A1O1_09278 [Capronia coronata CBS 617.96]EXJ78876.1 hypothetical protein A1O1_09278 [Capronia coronata CBS 617.96]